MPTIDNLCKGLGFSLRVSSSRKTSARSVRITCLTGIGQLYREYTHIPVHRVSLHEGRGTYLQYVSDAVICSVERCLSLQGSTSLHTVKNLLPFCFKYELMYSQWIVPGSPNRFHVGTVRNIPFTTAIQQLPKSLFRNPSLSSTLLFCEHSTLI